MQNKKFYATGLISLILFIILTITVKVSYTHLPIPGFDPALQTFAYHLQSNPVLLPISKLIATCLGDTGGFVLALVVFLLLFFAFKQRLEAVWFAIISVVGIGFNTALKSLIGRARPTVHRLPAYAHEPGMSFASGHSLFATLLFGCLFLIIAYRLKSKAGQWIVALVALLLILLAMFSRILLGVHYPSDTVGGLLLGLTLIGLTYPYLRSYQKNRLG